MMRTVGLSADAFTCNQGEPLQFSKPRTSDHDAPLSDACPTRRVRGARQAGTWPHCGSAPLLTLKFPVVGTGVDPVTSRFSGARSTN